MKGFYATKLKILTLSIFGFVLYTANTTAQVVSPYSLTNEWRFGSRAGLSFPNGDFPTSGGPSATPTTSNPETESVEASTSISDTAGNIAVYSNTMQVRNVANNSIRDLRSGADNTCGGSATGGGVMIPDPARPHDTYYLFIANDVTGGNCGNRGINYYKFRKNGGVVTYLSGPTNLIASPNVDESICAGSDGNGNYWIASHDQASNKFKLWNVTAGGVSARADQAIGPSGVVTGNS